MREAVGCFDSRFLADGDESIPCLVEDQCSLKITHRHKHMRHRAIPTGWVGARDAAEARLREATNYVTVRSRIQ